MKDGIDGTSVEGVSNMPYGVPNFRAGLHTTDVGVPVLWWRSVGHTHTAYVVETIMDRLATAAGRDPVEFRLALLGDNARRAGVLKFAAEKAAWTTPPPAGIFRGVAVHESFHTFVAHVAEVSLSKSGRRRSNASSARSIVGSPSIPTSSKRRWRAAWASVSGRRYATRSR